MRAGLAFNLNAKICAQSEPVYDLTAIDTGLKKGVWGESRLAFESIVEEVRRFVARMPPVDSTTGWVCCLWSFSASEDQRAEILPVQRPPALAVGGRCMMRLTRILMFPFFSLSIMNQLPLHRGAFQNAQRTFLGNFRRRIYALNRPVNLVEIIEKPKILPRRSSGLLPAANTKTVRLWDLSAKILRPKRRPENTGGFKPVPCRHPFVLRSKRDRLGARRGESLFSLVSD